MIERGRERFAARAGSRDQGTDAREASPRDERGLRHVGDACVNSVRCKTSCERATGACDMPTRVRNSELDYHELD